MQRHIVMPALAATLVAAGLSSVASAGDAPKRTPDELFQHLDTDADGLLTKAEFMAEKTGKKAERRARAFAKIDANADGSLDREEFIAKVEHHRSTE